MPLSMLASGEKNQLFRAKGVYRRLGNPWSWPSISFDTLERGYYNAPQHGLDIRFPILLCATSFPSTVLDS